MADTSNKTLAAEFTRKLTALKSEKDRIALQRYFKTGKGEYGEGDQFIGVKMGTVFKLAKEFMHSEPGEIIKLLDSPIHELRAGAVSIMDYQARSRKTSPQRRKELFDLYLKKHDRINNWDLVDRSAPYVIGGYLFDKSRAVLYKLARAKNVWKRRTAMVGTFYFIRMGETAETFQMAEVLLGDRHDLIHKAAGWGLRAAGDKDRARLLAFLNKHAATMPRTMLRYAIEHLDKAKRGYYLRLRK